MEGSLWYVYAILSALVATVFVILRKKALLKVHSFDFESARTLANFIICLFLPWEYLEEFGVVNSFQYYYLINTVLNRRGVLIIWSLLVISRIFFKLFVIIGCYHYMFKGQNPKLQEIIHLMLIFEIFWYWFPILLFYIFCNYFHFVFPSAILVSHT